MDDGTMETAALRIGCKVNLTLRITGVRPNGWHELDTVFLPLAEPSDTLRLALRPGGGLALHCAEPGIDPENNTLTKAYRLFAEASGFRPGVEAVLEKGIPHGAGLGEAEGAGRQFIIAPAQDEFHDSFARARREAAGQEHLFAFGPRASDNFIGGDFVPHGDIHGDSTGVAPLGEGEDTPLDGGGMAFPLGGVKGFTGAYQLGTQDISVRGGEAGGRTRRGRG